MIIALIAAVADTGIIGIENRMPWHLPADMRYFRHTTTGKPVLMGRLTFESIGAKPLPRRQNVVVTRDPSYTAPGCDVVDSIDAALELVKDAEEVMIMGGISFYAQMLPRAQRFYLTEVHADIEGDASFPEFDRAEWREVSREEHPADDENPYPYACVVLER